MELVELASSLTLKNAERIAIAEEINKLKKIRETFVGRLKIVTCMVDGMKCDAVRYEISPVDLASPIPLESKKIGEEMEVLLKSKDVTVAINVTEINIDDSSENSASAVCYLNVTDVPDNLELRTELGGSIIRGSTESVNLFHVKAGYDSFDELLRSKNIEMEQATVEYENIRISIKTLQQQDQPPASRQKPVKDKKKKKKQQSAVESPPINSNDELQDGDISEHQWGFQSSVESLTFASQFALQHRAYFLFAAAAVSIFFLGDTASV